MNNIYTLLFQKGDGDVVSSFDEWGIACCQVPFTDGDEMKDLPKRDWNDEHGEDVYFPKKLMAKAYDAVFELAYVGKELANNPFDVHLAQSQIAAFRKWLSGNDTENGSGTSLKIYSPYNRVGRQSCYLKSISDKELHVQLKEESGNVYNENIATFKAEFRVCDPTTDILLNYGT